MQNDDLIDPDYYDAGTGQTNLELMQAGNAPIGPDGLPIDLHHWTQQDPGLLGEISGSLHEREHSTLHPVREGIGRLARRDFGRFRADYWQRRALDFMPPPGEETADISFEDLLPRDPEPPFGRGPRPTQRRLEFDSTIFAFSG